MNAPIKTVDLSRMPKAVDAEAQIKRNREIILALPEPVKGYGSGSLALRALL